MLLSRAKATFISNVANISVLSFDPIISPCKEHYQSLQRTPSVVYAVSHFNWQLVHIFLMEDDEECEYLLCFRHIGFKFTNLAIQHSGKRGGASSNDAN